jgi:hypothetical protein
VDFLNGAAYVLKPPVDAVGEFKLQTNAFGAEFGRAGGAVLNVSLKSGTNKFHGAGWEFVRNDCFDAADFFQNAEQPAERRVPAEPVRRDHRWTHPQEQDLLVR